MAAQIPGFQWLPANTTHFEKGRKEKIRGGAQHYTAGTDSRAWLTWSSGQDHPSKRVSSTFLIRKNATLEFRGWQLVKIEDTAWTTAFANPYTVSIEYEHRVGQPIPDMDYTVIAQTWIDAARYVAEHGHGEIPMSRQGIRGHKEWVNNPSMICPDGVVVDRVVAEIDRLLKGQELPTPSARFFPETGHYIAHGFKGFWESRNNPAEDGFPLTEEFAFETDDGKIVTAQYFERARYEWQQDIADNVHGVVLGRIGAEAINDIRERYPDAFVKRPAPGSAEVPLVSLDSWIPVRDPNDITAKQIVDACYRHGRSPKYSREKIEKIANAIVTWSAVFGFRTSICAGQIFHETGFFQFGGQVQPHQNNYAGLGATNDGAAGASFPNESEGVLAVMAHLSLYVYGEPSQWPASVQQYANRAIRLDAVREAHTSIVKPDGQRLMYLGAVNIIRDFTNGRWAYSPQYPRGTLQNGYANSLVRVTNGVISGT